MRTASLLVLILGMMSLPTFCQTTMSPPSITDKTPLLYAATMAASTDLKLTPFDADGGGNPVFPNVAPVTPSPAAVRALVQSDTRQAKPKIMEWKFSLLALAAAHSADAATSWNKRELNPLLSPTGGAFGAQMLAIKCAVTAGSITMQAVLLKHHPQLAKMFARFNFIESGVIGATAIHNSFVPGR